MNDQRTSRRDFLHRTGAAVAGGVFLGAGPSSLLAQTPTQRPVGANERILLGLIGVGNQGRSHLTSQMREIIAVCDVDRDHLNEARDRVQRTNGGQCAAHADFRRVLDDRNVNAVIIVTPDHWHALPTVLACQAGKHVYCEKPLTLTIAEGQTMVRAARHNRVIVQTGSQQRSDERFRRACEIIRNGGLGELRQVRVGIPRVNFSGPPVADSAPPANLDYPFWLGPAPERPYNPKRVHYNFRFFWDYSGGQQTNWGAHHLDIVQWALGMDESGPVRVEGTARYHAQRWFEVPESYDLTYTYASGLRVLAGNQHPGGVTFEGARGTLHVNRGRLEATPPELLRWKPGVGATRLMVSRNHHQNWRESIRSGQLPICDVAIGHRSATVCHLGNIALRSGKAVTWDPAREVITGDAEQARMVSRPYRTPWRLPEIPT